MVICCVPTIPPYQRFRALVRDPAWRAAFLARPLAERKLEIETLRASSEAEKKTKPAAIMDVNAEAVVAALATHGARAIIHGHTHRPARHDLVDGRHCGTLGTHRLVSAGELSTLRRAGCRSVPF